MQPEAPIHPEAPIPPRRVFLVSHTHWDREWYLTCSRFRVDLVAAIDRVLDTLEEDPEFRHFVLDGQTAVLEDYLDASPGQAERVARLIRRGRLVVGPWYVLPDEFLVGGEATVRNLRRGHHSPAADGQVQKVGYMPDSFGHVAQMPQLLRLAGIDSFIFTRGLGDEAAGLGWLFQWAAPDGSTVLAVNQCDGYCNAGGLGFAELWHAHTRRRVELPLAVAKVAELLARMAQRPGADPALLNNGCDHFPPQQDFAGVLAALRAAYPGTKFVHGTFADFLRAARAGTLDDARPRHCGELLGGRDHLILSGVWSARMVLKQLNERCQNLLCRYLEPALAAERFLRGGSWPQGLLDEAWRELLRNHPHDSICGCSTDAVHRDMLTRFAAVEQTSRQMLSRLMERICPLFGTTATGDRRTVITVLNPLPVRRDEVIDRLVVLQPLGYDLDDLRLLDESGRAIPLEIISRRFVERFWGVDYRQESFCPDQLTQLQAYLDHFGARILGTAADRDTRDCFLHVRFLARDLPACGHARFFLTDEGPPDGQGSPGAAVDDPVHAVIRDGCAVLGNARIEAALHPDGTFDLLDRTSGRRFAGLNLLEDSGDCGDEYDHGAMTDDRPIFSAGAKGLVRIRESGGLAGVVEADFPLAIPRALRSDRSGRTRRTVACPVTVRLELRAGARRLDITTECDNRARDHRLRAWFPTGLTAAETVADGHFFLNRRPLVRPTGPDWAQPAPPTWPQQDFTAIQDTRGGLAICNRGLPEFETWTDAKGATVYSLTLLRCVGWLSRDDFASRRRTNAGPTLFTPEAQCLGRHTFHYAVVPFSGDLLGADIKGESDRYRVPPLTGQGVADQSLPGGLSLVEKTDPRVAVTAIVQADDGDRLIVRLYNQAAESVTEKLRCGLPVLDAAKVGILQDDVPEDRPPPRVHADKSAVTVPLLPFEIATLALRLEKKETP